MTEYLKLKKKYDKNFKRAVKKLQDNCDHEWGKWFVPFVNGRTEMRFCEICKLTLERPLLGRRK